MHACFLTIFYLILVNEANALNYDFFWKTLVLIASMALYIVYMFLVNDYFDIPTDKIAGKKRQIHDMPKTLVVGLLVLITLLSCIATILLMAQTLYVLIYAMAYFLATFYSAPPLRFKCRGFLGTIYVALIEKPIPALIIFSFFQHFHIDTLIFISFFFVWQLELILHHQYLDYEGDLKAQIKTYAIEIGLNKTKKILEHLQPLITAFSFVVYGLIFIEIPYSTIFLILMIAAYFFIRKLKQSRLLIREPGSLGPSRYYVEGMVMPLYYSLTNVFLEGPLPLFVGLLLTLRFAPYVLVLSLSIASQYYLIMGHYIPTFLGALSLFRKIFSR